MKAGSGRVNQTWCHFNHDDDYNAGIYKNRKDETKKTNHMGDEWGPQVEVTTHVKEIHHM